jgi:hypothetical protein
LLKKKRPVASSSGTKDVTGNAVSQALIPGRESRGVESPPETPPLNPDRNGNDPSPESPRTGESAPVEEKQAGKRTQKTLFDGF